MFVITFKMYSERYKVTTKLNDQSKIILDLGVRVKIMDKCLGMVEVPIPYEAMASKVE